MPILKQTQTPFGAAVGFHLPCRTEIDIQGEHQVAMVQVQSWPTELDYIASEGRGAAWNWQVSVPLAALAGATFAASVELALTLDENSPFVGGSIAPFASGVEAARVRQWARIKQTRNLLEQDSFMWDGSRFNADAVAQQRISRTLLSAQRALAAGGAWSVYWTLYDNTVRELSALDMVALSDAAFLAGRALHYTAATLREQIFDPTKTTVAEVEAVVWPVLTTPP